VGSLNRRLERLEQQRGLKRREPSEGQRKQAWLTRARVRRNHDKGDWHVRDTIKLLQRQGRLGTTAEDLRACLLAWRPELDRTAIEREIARTIYYQEEGAENMVCPPAWREAFVAADELREKYAAVPEETLAQWVVWQHGLEEGAGDDVAVKISTEGNGCGITNELLWKAIGPDAEEITDDECMRRLREIFADFFYGEQGYRVQQHIDRLVRGGREASPPPGALGGESSRGGVLVSR
jgi:hypothetical protein